MSDPLWATKALEHLTTEKKVVLVLTRKEARALAAVAGEGYEGMDYESARGYLDGGARGLAAAGRALQKLRDAINAEVPSAR